MKPRVKPPVKSMGPLMRTVFAAVVLLGALALVPWRQSRALRGAGAASISCGGRLRGGGGARRPGADASRSWRAVAGWCPLARERLGMHTPSATELVILPGDPNP